MGKLILTFILFSSVCVFSSGLLTSDPVPESVKNDRDDYKLVLNDTTLFVTHAKCQTGCDIRRRACENETLNRVCILQSTQDPMQGWKSCMTDKHELNSDNLICSRGWILPGGLECRSRCPAVFAALSWEKINDETVDRGGGDIVQPTFPHQPTRSPEEKGRIAASVLIPLVIIIVIMIVAVLRARKIQRDFKQYRGMEENARLVYDTNNPWITKRFKRYIHKRGIILPGRLVIPSDGANGVRTENDVNGVIENTRPDPLQVRAGEAELLIPPDVEAGQPSDVHNDDHGTTPQALPQLEQYAIILGLIANKSRSDGKLELYKLDDDKLTVLRRIVIDEEGAASLTAHGRTVERFKRTEENGYMLLKELAQGLICQDRVDMANETDQLSGLFEPDKEPGPSGTPGASGAPGPSSRPPPENDANELVEIRLDDSEQVPLISPDRIDMVDETDQLSGPIEPDKEPGPSGAPGASGAPGPSSRPPPGPSPPLSPLEDTDPDMLSSPRSRPSDPSGDTRHKDNARVRLGKRTVPVNSTLYETPQPQSMSQTAELDLTGEERGEKDFRRLYKNVDPLNEERRENMAMDEPGACGGNDSHADLQDHSTESSAADGNASDQDATLARTQERVASAAGLQAEVVAPSPGTFIHDGTRLTFADSNSKPGAVLFQSEEASAPTDAEPVLAEVMSASTAARPVQDEEALAPTEAEPVRAEVLSASTETNPVQAEEALATTEAEPVPAEEALVPPNESSSQSRVAPSQLEGTATEFSGPDAAQSAEQSSHQTLETEAGVKKAPSIVEVKPPDAENPEPSPSSSQNSMSEDAGGDGAVRPANKPSSAVPNVDGDQQTVVEDGDHSD